MVGVRPAGRGGIVGVGAGLTGRGIVGVGAGLTGRGIVGVGAGLTGRSIVGVGAGLTGRGIVGGLTGCGIGGMGVWSDGRGILTPPSLGPSSLFRFRFISDCESLGKISSSKLVKVGVILISEGGGALGRSLTAAAEAILPTSFTPASAGSEDLT